MQSVFCEHTAWILEPKSHNAGMQGIMHKHMRCVLIERPVQPALDKQCKGKCLCSN